jgi:undecaprenyl-diphosphatase
MSGAPDPAGRRGPLGPTPPDAGDAQSNRWRTALLALGMTGLLVCLLVLGSLAAIVQNQEEDALDTMATPFLHRLASPGLDLVMNIATFLGSDPSLVAIAVVAGGCLVRLGRRREALFVGLTLGGSIVLNLAMKTFFHRARPALPWAHVLPDYSFPSGHSMNSMAVGLALGIVAWRIAGPRWGLASLAVAVVVSLTIGASRIYLGYHYFTDVAAGFTAAILWVVVVVAVLRASRWRRRRDSRT